MDFHFATYNTHLFGTSLPSYLPHSTADDTQRAEQIATALQRKKFHFVGLQEVFDPKLLPYFQAAHDFKTLYATDVPEGKILGLFPKVISAGLILMSRYKLLDCQTTYFQASAGAERLVARGVIAAYCPQGVIPESPPFCLFVTHTHWGGDDPKNRSVRMDNIRELRQIVMNYRQKHGNPAYVILGDLNITEGTPDYEELMTLFPDCRNAEASHHPTCDPTANTLLQKFHPEYIRTGKTKIDYILYSAADWELLHSEVMPKAWQTPQGQDLSDHYLLSATLASR